MAYEMLAFAGMMLGVLKSQALLVDDHPLFRSGLATALRSEPDIEVVGEASTAEEAVAIVRSQPIDICVVDLLMPATSGISLASEVLDVRPTCRILALSVLDEPTMIATMLRAGATGYALKTQAASEILEALRSVLAGVRYLPPTAPAQVVMAQVNHDIERPLQWLTRREREVFELLIRGATNDDIATKLFIARRTVETHRQRIMKKLSTHSIIEMIRLAARQGALASDT